jgi:hypothetical protein
MTTLNGHLVGNPGQEHWPLASLSNKQCDGLSVAEVLKETLANRFLPTICRKTNAREADRHHPHYALVV